MVRKQGMYFPIDNNSSNHTSMEIVAQDVAPMS